ncbi:ATP-grasp domain-containing protein [Kaarinaea lacus]
MLNPYASIITREASRRGINVDVLDEEAAYFSLSYQGDTIVCRESLSERTTAIAMSRCDDKAVTTRLMQRAGVQVPAQHKCGEPQQNAEFLQKFGHVVVKPSRGEQGAGVCVDITTVEQLNDAIDIARRVSNLVLLEEYVSGHDLRVVVINGEVVAAAERKPPQVIGDGKRNIEQLIDAQSRLREEATAGESHIPKDGETQRCVQEAGFQFDDVLPDGEVLIVRKADNLHAGATIEDATDKIHPHIKDVSIRAAQALNIPVVGLDFIVPELDSDDYVFIEANERPGLANHEPQPTAERFIDFLFPQTAKHQRQ